MKKQYFTKYHSLQLEKPCTGGRKKISGKMSKEECNIKGAVMFSVTAVIKTQ